MTWRRLPKVWSPFGPVEEGAVVGTRSDERRAMSDAHDSQEILKRFTDEVV